MRDAHVVCRKRAGVGWRGRTAGPNQCVFTRQFMPVVAPRGHTHPVAAAVIRDLYSAQNAQRR
jgi:hypothetical protein